MKRRNLLLGTAAVLGTSVVAWGQRNPLFEWLLTRAEHDIALTEAPIIGDEVCVLTEEQVEGPYHVSSETRSNIREDVPGMPLSLDLQIVDAEECVPVAGAAVEIWHCDAAGVYSVFPADLARDPTGTMAFIAGSAGKPATTNKDRFLRGVQVCDTEGLVHFDTIIPG